jgi:hypothetical protein
MLTRFFLWLGLSRDDRVWLWSKIVSASALLTSGLVPLDNYVTPAEHKAITILAVCVLFLAGSYSTSPLPGKLEKDQP